MLVWTGSACLLGLGMPPATGGKLAFSPTQTQEQVRRTLTFAERAAYQYAIEEVYWRHRIWPRENPGPKPRLDAIVSQRQIEHKVEEYLRKSRLVANERESAITVFELQTEMAGPTPPYGTGSEMIVWGGGNVIELNTGGMYIWPDPKSWTG